MQKKSIISRFILVLTLTTFVIAGTIPSVRYVSSSISSVVKPFGSVAGGTTVYIFGNNFGSDPSAVAVFFGNYPCNLVAGTITPSTITCVTTAATNPNHQWNQPLVLNFVGQSPLKSYASNCVFTYTKGNTPVVQELIPKTVKQNDILHVFGLHRITYAGDGRSTTVGQVDSLQIDGKTCSLVDVPQQETVQSDIRDFINCKVMKANEAGEYNFLQQVDPGYANSSIRLSRTSAITGNNYQIRVAPEIISDFSHQGGTEGQRLPLTINAKSASASAYSCQIAGQNCSISEINIVNNKVYVQVPKYDPLNTNFGRLSKDQNDTSTQSSPFLGSNGFKYTRYAFSDYHSLQDWATILRSENNSLQVLQSQTIYTQLSSGEVYGKDSYLEYLTGYLHIPVAGTYTFYALADDGVVVKLSKVQNNSNPLNLQTIILVDSWVSNHYNSFTKDNTKVSSQKYFSVPGYYYMQVAAINNGNTGYFKVMMSTPNLGISAPANPTWQIDYFGIKQAGLKPEIINVTVNQALIGNRSFALNYFIISSPSYVQSSGSIVKGMTADAFTSALGPLYTLSQFTPTVSLNLYDANKLRTINASAAAYYEYLITLTKWRDTSTYNLPFVLTQFASAVSVTKSQAHSAPISGTFKLFINGQPLLLANAGTYSLADIPYDVDEWNLQAAFNNFYKSNEISVKYLMDVNKVDSIEFFVEYLGISNVLPLTTNTKGLNGGFNNKFNTNYTVQRNYSSTRPYFDPIPYQFLRTAEDSPQLYLAVNKMPAACSNCRFVFNQSLYLQLTSANITNSQLLIALSNPNSITYSLSDISMSFLGVQCAINGSFSTLTNIACDFPLTSNGNPQIPAGTGKPIVHITQIGYADVSAISNITLNFQVSSFSPTSSSPTGLIQASILGKGFPVSSDSGSIQISLCGNIVTKFLSVQSDKITFLIPAQGSTCTGNPSYIQVNGAAQLSLVFSYQPTLTPLISKLEPSSFSPIRKGTLTITGSNFLTATTTRVFLYDANQTAQYQLKVLNITSTQIVCILGGGKTGSYNVRVLNQNQGLSIVSSASLFQYQIFVYDINPTSGSFGGGYNITISGANFASIDTTNVFIGSAMNAVCNVLEINSTTIICNMPMIDSSYISNTTQSIIVTGRIVETSVCQGSCQFTYDITQTNNVTKLANSIYSTGSTVTVNGSDLTGAVPYVGGAKAKVLSTNSTTISFEYPSVSAGTNQILLLTNNGYAYPSLLTTTNLWFGNSLQYVNGSYGGHIINVTGNGMSQNLNDGNVYSLVCGSKTLYPTRTYASATVHTIQLPNNPFSYDNTCRLNITQGQTIKLYNYTYLKSLNSLLQATLTSANETFQYYLTTTNPNISIQIAWAQVLDISGTVTNSTYALNLSSINSTTYLLTPVKGYLPAGTLKVRAHSAPNGFLIIAGENINITMNIPSGQSKSISFAGAATYTISSTGFIDTQIKNNYVSICGMRAPAVTATQSTLTVSIPPLITSLSQSQFGLNSISIINGIGFSDSPSATNRAFDFDSTTTYSSSAQKCYIGVDFGIDAAANISTIKYMGNSSWPITALYLNGGIFEGSNDNSTWNTIFVVDTNVHSGWNTWTNNFQTSVIYRYVRLRHNSLSNCQIAQLQFTGQIYSTFPVNITSGTACPVKVVLYQNTIAVSGGVINYSPAATSNILSITPSFGPTSGGTSINIKGNNFGTAITVTIDDIPCVISAQNATNIVCTTGTRANPPSDGNTFVVLSDSNKVILSCDPYLYIDRWSDERTWGGEAIPRQGDSVLVPKGMTLLVDVSTPILYTVIVDGGKIIFADESDMTFDCSFFIMNGGEFRAGTSSSPYQHMLTFTLHGDYYGKQLPIFGNKVIGCKNCKFNLHGQVRNPTWTDLNATVNAGGVTIKLNSPVDWLPGESIAVASSSFDHYESQQKIIASKSADNMSITVTTPFKFKHFAGIESYGGKDFVMRTQVGLLTRNIKMQGDSTSSLTSYGSHLMLNGKAADGLDASISYAQFTNCGQPSIVGRYCTHFHMAGEVPNSFVRGISVHNSFARLLTIHATYFLLVQKNVGYRIQGHNIFIEDGIQTNNIIQDNLMISSITSFTMLQSDITVASYWVTNPLNTLIRNRAAGGDFYGFWYEIKPNPDGPSATPDICPTGMQLGPSRDNIAHSYVRFGLRVFVLSSRKYPCLPTQNQSLIDPYSVNPSIQSRFENYTLWKNAQAGFLGEQLGHVTINDFKIIDSGLAGMDFYQTNQTIEDVVANNSVIVGYSSGNGPLSVDIDYKNVRGLITPRTDGLYVDNLQFINFGSTMTPLQSCSQCENGNLWVTGGKTTTFRNITYNNITGNYIFWQIWRRQIFLDVDGSLTYPALSLISPPLSQKANVSITPYRPSLNISQHCYRLNSSLWNDSSFCDGTLRAVLFANAMPTFVFTESDIKVKVISNPYENISALNFTQDNFSDEPQITILKHSMDIPGAWSMPFYSGQYYNVHWKWGLDFDHLALAPSRLWNDDDGIVLRFNYSAYRQLYEIGKWYQEKLQLPYIVPSDTLIDPTSCVNGDYFHDKNSSYLFVCVSGRNKTIREWTNIDSIKCMYNCPLDNTTTVVRQNFTRLWSNASQWPGGALPKAADNITINPEWNIVLDIDTPIFNYVQVKGYLYFNQQANNIFQAYYIWVKGKIIIGSKQKPYLLNATIVLHGQKDTPYLVVDQYAQGNKMMVVTGGLEFYGSVTDNIWTRLTSIAQVGSSSITVQDASGWTVGDSLIIGASYSSPTQNQQVTITGISGNTITFIPALSYQHYGDSNITLQNTYGSLDARAAVSKLNRNIKITKAPDANGWGCRVLIYSYLQIPKALGAGLPQYTNGYAIFDGVEFDNCAQYDTMYAGLSLSRIGKNKPVTTATSITRSSFHNCVGMCVYIDQSANITFNNNVFFNARKFLVYVSIINNYTFTNNLLIYAHKRVQLQLNGTNTVEEVSCYSQYRPLDYANQNVLVTKNLAQGCQGQGFVFPFAPCQYLNTYNFAGNTAGSCQVGFMLNFMDNQDCVGSSGLTAYSNLIGLMAHPPGTQSKLIYQNMFFTDNQRGITLRFAHQYSDNTLYVNNSYFAGYSRPNCQSCYSRTTNSFCKGGYAVRMLSTSFGGEKFPLSKANIGFDIVCNQMAYDAKSFFDNVVFQNYKYNNSQQAYCTNMNVFKRHPQASDQIGSAYLTNTKCKNCDKQAWAYFQPPSPSWRGWFGGCGELDCTGPNNYFVHDQDGSFTGSPSQLLANNSMIGSNQSSCSFVPQMNGYYCLTEQFAVMQYQSIAPDYNTRIMWPVYLNYDGGPWKSVTNAYREWEWMGAQPLNKRLARFWSVVVLHKTYNLTYASSPPTDSRFQIQKRLMPNGNSADWVIVRILYPIPNSLDVLVSNSSATDLLVKPYPLVEGIPENLTKHVEICGANNFHYQNGTIQFVLNGLNNCQVRIKKSSYIQLSVSLSVSVNDFYSNNGTTTFISNICAFLKIDPGRLKIVSVRTGSVNIMVYIIPLIVSILNSTNSNNPSSTQATLDTLSNTINQGLTTQSLDVGFPLLSYNLTTAVFNTDGTVYQIPKIPIDNGGQNIDNGGSNTNNGGSPSDKSNSKILLIILTTVVPAVVILLVLITIAMIRKRSQVHSDPQEFSIQQHSENIMPANSDLVCQKHQVQKENFAVNIQEFD